MPHDLGGLVLHLHHALGMAKGHARRKFGVGLQKRPQDGLVPVQDRIQPGIAGDRISKASNDSCRPAIATHGVN